MSIQEIEACKMEVKDIGLKGTEEQQKYLNIYPYVNALPWA